MVSPYDKKIRQENIKLVSDENKLFLRNFTTRMTSKLSFLTFSFIKSQFTVQVEIYMVKADSTEKHTTVPV